MIAETTAYFAWPDKPSAVNKTLTGLDSDVEAQGARLHQHLKDSGYSFPSVSAKEYHSNPILKWTGGGSKRITDIALGLNRGMTPGELEALHGLDQLKTHDNLMQHLALAPELPEDAHVYSGISTSFADNLRDLSANDAYTTESPISTSLHPRVAYRRGYSGHMINILLHGNTSPGLYIGGMEHAFAHGRPTAEYEFITKPKRRLLLIGRQKTRLPDNNPLTIHNFVDVTGK